MKTKIIRHTPTRIRIRIRIRTCLIAVAVFVISGILTATPAMAMFPVFDATNAAMLTQQLAKQAAEIANQIQQIQHQVQALQNQARMLENLKVSNYQDAIAAMQRVQNVLRQNCGEMGTVPNRIGFTSGFDCAALMARFRRAYPAAGDWAGQSDTQLAQYPDQWNTQRRAAAYKAIRTQEASVQAMTGNANRMAQLAAASQNAPGQKAATQVTNQMLVTLSAQLRDQQAAAVADQRTRAIKTAQNAAWRQRNHEVIHRLTRDAHTHYNVQPVNNPFAP